MLREQGWVRVVPHVATRLVRDHAHLRARLVPGYQPDDLVAGLAATVADPP
jgi:hypothetical protein